MLMNLIETALKCNSNKISMSLLWDWDVYLPPPKFANDEFVLGVATNSIRFNLISIVCRSFSSFDLTT